MMLIYKPQVTLLIVRNVWSHISIHQLTIVQSGTSLRRTSSRPSLPAQGAGLREAWKKYEEDSLEYNGHGHVQLMLGKDTSRVAFGFQRQTEDVSSKVDGSKVSNTINDVS